MGKEEVAAKGTRGSNSLEMGSNLKKKGQRHWALNKEKDQFCLLHNHISKGYYSDFIDEKTEKWGTFKPLLTVVQK